MQRQKMYVLDTNVFLHDPRALYQFKAHVVIPFPVLEELDKFKGESSDRGYNARETVRILDHLRVQGSLTHGVQLEDGAFVTIVLPYQNMTDIPDVLREGGNDNTIVRTALQLKREGHEIVLISKDLNMRLKANALDIPSEDYESDNISRDTFYRGWKTFQVSAGDMRNNPFELLKELAQEYTFTVNEFALLESKHNPHNYTVFRHTPDGGFKHVSIDGLVWPLEPKNAQQLMALDLLMDDSIQLVTLFGPSGTGKTFLTLVAALHKVLIEHVYQKMMVSRPVIPLGPDIGYLPGDLNEKLSSWMQPIRDNMEFIVYKINSAQHGGSYEDLVQGRKHKKDNKRERPSRMMSMESLVNSGKIDVEAITYMRGRSIPYQFIFIDEVQNLTPHEVKTIISRVGEGSKIVLAGDPYQIDSPYLDFISNGLVVASERFKGQDVFGTVYLDVSERSILSSLANQLL